MSNLVTVEFEYDHIEAGAVSVEAHYTVVKPDFYSKESDWDYNGMQELEYIAVFQKGQQIMVDIPEDVLYHYLRNKLRDLEISACYLTESGEI